MTNDTPLQFPHEAHNEALGVTDKLMHPRETDRMPIQKSAKRNRYKR